MAAASAADVGIVHVSPSTEEAIRRKLSRRAQRYARDRAREAQLESELGVGPGGAKHVRWLDRIRLRSSSSATPAARRTRSLTKMKRRLLCAGLTSFIAGAVQALVAVLLSSRVLYSHRMRWGVSAGVQQSVRAASATAVLSGAWAVSLWCRWPRWRRRIARRGAGSILCPHVASWLVVAGAAAGCAVWAAVRALSTAHAAAPGREARTDLLSGDGPLRAALALAGGLGVVVVAVLATAVASVCNRWVEASAEEDALTQSAADEGDAARAGA
eukprot:g7073.t1